MSDFFRKLLGNILSSSGSLNHDAQIFLKGGSGGEKIQFPVPPGEFRAKVQQNNQTVNISNIGDINMIGNDGLKEVSFSSFFPAQEYSFCVCTPESPYSYVQTIDKWRKGRLPCRITIADTEVNLPVTIESFEYGEEDGTGDVVFSLDLKEDVFVGGAADNTVDDVSGLKGRNDISSMNNAARSITVYPGDSVMDVAARAVGRNLSISDKSKSHLKLYKVLAKGGGLSPGDVLKTTSGGNVKMGGNIIMF